MTGRKAVLAPGWVLKACVFATGLSGIVAEYVMATMASYLLGDAVVQWTLVISSMLFAMGVGSRLSRHVERRLVDTFIVIELVLSLLVAAAPLVVWSLAVRVDYLTLVIYGLAIAIGVLIGAEIPIATRINEAYEELRVNISGVIEKDYYGALAGGLIFAFLALPHLGLTYTPIALGALNLIVAALLMIAFADRLRYKRWLIGGFGTVAVALVGLSVTAEPIVQWGEQGRYRDRVVYQEQTRYQRIVMTQWRDDHWLYLDSNLQFSSRDEVVYHESLVRPALGIAARRAEVLVLGGGDGLAIREVLRYDDVERVTLVDLDPAMTALARSHPVLVALNEGVLEDPRVEIVHADAYTYIADQERMWDVVIIDLPDPKTVSLARLYSVPFYRRVVSRLSPGGVLVTQATSPYFSRHAFISIWKSVAATGLIAVPYHQHVTTMGEWGWVLGWKPPARGFDVPSEPVEDLPELAVAPSDHRVEIEYIRRRLSRLEFADTHFLNRAAMVSMLHFGKGILDDSDTVTPSGESDLTVYHAYRRGAWDLY